MSIVECVCGRESSDQEEVKLIMTFFQEISQCSDMFIKVMLSIYGHNMKVFAIKQYHSDSKEQNLNEIFFFIL